MLTVSDAGKQAMLGMIVRSGLTLHLYGASPDNELRGGGYAPQKLAAKGWTLRGGVAIHAEVPFTFSGATTPDVINGYLVKLGNITLWTEPISEPFPVAIKGDTLVITPTFALSGM